MCQASRGTCSRTLGWVTRWRGCKGDGRLQALDLAFQAAEAVLDLALDFGQHHQHGRAQDRRQVLAEQIADVARIVNMPPLADQVSGCLLLGPLATAQEEEQADDDAGTD